MKRFLFALALVAVAGATYVATAPGSQTAGPTAKQFKALKKQVTKLQKDEKLVKSLALDEAFLLIDCMSHSVPIGQFGEGAGFGSTYGYTWTDPADNGGVPWLETALDVTASDDPYALWITGGGSACGSDLNGSLRRVARLAGIDLHAAPLHGFSARH
jgi:hypothetical protein